MFNDRLRATRIARGITLRDMAEQLDIRLRNYQKYESGDSLPTYDKLIRIADFLSVPIDFLLERDDYLQGIGVSVAVPLECPPRRPGPSRVSKSH